MAGKYKCLLCQKEFVSESGVKYHINSVHAEVRSLLSHSAFVILWTLYMRHKRGEFSACFYGLGLSTKVTLKWVPETLELKYFLKLDA